MAGLELFVLLDGAAQLALERRRQVGVGVQPKGVEPPLERFVRVEDALSRDSLLVAGPAPGANAAKLRSRDSSTSRASEPS